MVDITFYLVTQEIAQRSGVIESRYRIKDCRFVLDNKDLSYIRFTPDEYIEGLEGVEKISKQDAMILIKENGYKMGAEIPVVVTSQQQEESVIEEPVDNTEGETTVEEPTVEEPTVEETTDGNNEQAENENNDGDNQENETNENKKEEE